MANLLMLRPAQPELIPPDSAALRQRLAALGLTGAPLIFEGREHYRPGENFLRLVTFLGCSPVVSLGEPGLTGDEFCHIDVDGPHDTIQFVSGNNAKLPRCPGCGYRIEEWPSLIAQWRDDNAYIWRCPLCSKEYPPPRLRWRQCAGFGRYFIRVWGIFEGEAVPSDELLATLREVSGFDWGYFYLQLKEGN